MHLIIFQHFVSSPFITAYRFIPINLLASHLHIEFSAMKESRASRLLLKMANEKFSPARFSISIHYAIDRAWYPAILHLTPHGPSTRSALYWQQCRWPIDKRPPAHRHPLLDYRELSGSFFILLSCQRYCAKSDVPADNGSVVGRLRITAFIPRISVTKAKAMETHGTRVSTMETWLNVHI